MIEIVFLLAVIFIFVASLSMKPHKGGRQTLESLCPMSRTCVNKTVGEKVRTTKEYDEQIDGIIRSCNTQHCQNFRQQFLDSGKITEEVLNKYFE